MPARITALWRELHTSLWFIPGLITVAAVLLFLGTSLLDSSDSAREGLGQSWGFGGGAEGARGVLGAIAGSVITVTGVVFSVTIVALQLASTQFTSRVLRGFMADRANQAVLGVFIGTFIYTLLTLRSVRSEAENGEAFIPVFSVAVAILIALVSMGFLIFFVDHVARSIQASTIIEQVVSGARHTIDTLFPDPPGFLGKTEMVDVPSGEPKHVRTNRTGYVTNLDEAALYRIATKNDLIVRVEPMVGDFILPGSSLALVWTLSREDPRFVSEIRDAFIVGRERTAGQDLDFQISQLVDIAVKALSPGINDPKTAEMCIDRLGEILVMLANRGVQETAKADDSGRTRLIIPRSTYSHYASLSFRKIRHYGAGTPSIALRTSEVLRQATELVPPGARATLIAEAAIFLASARREIADPHDLTTLEIATSWLSEQSEGLRLPSQAA